MYIFFCIVVVFALLLTLNYIIFRRSFMASIVELYLRLSPFKKRTLQKIINRNSSKKGVNYKPPKLHCQVDLFQFEDMPTYVLSGKNNKSDYLIFYLHGGAYVNRPLKYHWKFCSKLVQKLNCTMIFPLYPLAPEHTWKDAHNKIKDLYKKVSNSFSGKIILMGDSAGGGFALSLNMQLAKEGINLPHKTILLSPWVDISLENKDIKRYNKLDPMLGVDGLKEFARSWAGDLPLTDYRLSPLYGNLDKLNNIYIFVGTREILYPDIINFCQKCVKAQLNVKCFVCKGMNHVYPIYPIPEAHTALKQICKIIKG